MKKQTEGVITVFLSLVFLLILAVIMSGVEGARVSTYKVIAESTLKGAINSILCDYYKPMYRNYHIFALDGGYGEDGIQKEKIENLIKEYMEYTFTSEKELDELFPTNYFNLYGINTNKAELKSEENLLSHKGAWYKKQAVDYMKYKTTGNIMEKLLQGITATNKNTELIPILEKKQAAEERVSAIEEDILLLMSYVDGISVNKNGLVIKGGYIKAKDSFVKKICPLEITSYNTKINNSWVFQSLKSNYKNPLLIGEAILKEIEAYFNNNNLKSNASSSYMNLVQVDRSKMKKEELIQLEEDIKLAIEDLRYYEEREEDIKNSIKNKLREIEKLLHSTIKSTEEAIVITDAILEKSKKASSEIKEYKSILIDQKENIPKEVYDNLLKDMKSLDKYLPEESPTDKEERENFQDIKKRLVLNKSILESIKHSLFSFETTNDFYEDITYIQLQIQQLPLMLQEYTFKDLVFDYSSFHIPENYKGFLDSINSLLGKEILEIVLEKESEVSERALTGTDLPSGNISREDNLGDSQDLEISSLASSGQIFNNLSSLFSHIDFEEILESIGSTLLFQEYMKEHFSHYIYQKASSSSENSKVMKEEERVLLYEMEYIVKGYDTDRENLSKTVISLLFIRLLSNFIAVLGDKSLGEEADIIAVGILGFTGMPVLVSILKYTILILYSLAEAMIDITVLLKEGQVTFIKRQEDFSLKLIDLIGINKEVIHQKANEKKAHSQNAEAKLLMDYKEYLNLLLLIEREEIKSLRSLDLIQENIRKNYNENFYIKNCIQSLQIESEFSMENKFAAFSFIDEMIRENKKLYTYSSIMEAAY